MLSWTRRNFNSRPSARGDSRCKRGEQNGKISIHAPPRGATDGGVARRNRRVISIHAPPRGATFVAFRQRLPCKFQFTPLREGRRRNSSAATRPPSFQFTPLREGRRLLPRWLRWDCYFNSRPSARGDSRPRWIACGASISIHAPPRGATWRTRRGRKTMDISIHAPPRGATNLRNGRKSRLMISIHAPPRGATFRRFCCAELKEFQFTPLREGRLYP